MILPVPFYANTEDNTHCFQAVLCMVLRYFEPSSEFCFDDLDQISGKEFGKWTWPMCGLQWLHDRGYEVKSVEIFNYVEFAEQGVEYIKKLYGPEVAHVQEIHSSFEKEQLRARSFATSGLWENRLPTIADVRRFVDEGYLQMINVNAQTLDEIEGYSGHTVLVVGYDDQQVILHDPGLPSRPFRRVATRLFERAWAYPDTLACNTVLIRPGTKMKNHSIE